MSSTHVKHPMHRFLKHALWEEVERVPRDAWHLGAHSNRSRKSVEGEDLRSLVRDPEEGTEGP